MQETDIKNAEEAVEQPEAKPAMIKLLATSTPSGATLSMGDTPLCPATPCDIEFGQDALEDNGSVSLTFAKAGYKTTTVNVTDPSLETGVNAELLEIVVEKPPSRVVTKKRGTAAKKVKASPGLNRSPNRSQSQSLNRSPNRNLNRTEDRTNA